MVRPVTVGVFTMIAAAVVLFLSVFRGLPSLAQTNTSAPDHVAWVAESLKRMETIQPGLTRAELLTVFTTEGGMSTPLRRTYVSRNCPYFKVDVEFRAVGRQPDAMTESGQDVIVQISRPYLQFTIAD